MWPLPVWPFSGNELHTLGGLLIDLTEKCHLFYTSWFLNYIMNIYVYKYLYLWFQSESTGISVFNKVRANNTRIYLEALFWPQSGWTATQHAGTEPETREGLQSAAGLYHRMTAAPGLNEDFPHCCWTGNDADPEKNTRTGWEAWLSIHLSGRGSLGFAYVLLFKYLRVQKDKTNPPF